ncbi:MAG: glycosyltransferase family 4 protein [Candidatus Methylomirabilales bacterium]
MNANPAASLFLLHTGSNVGYAISPLETLFYESGLELGGEDRGRVHFAFRHLDGGHPRSVPQDFTNVIAFDFTDTSPGNIERLAAYVRQHHIRLVLIFDIQPIHPLFRPLRQAGVKTILSYHGAQISSYMPAWKLTIKRLQIATSRSRVDGLIFESQAMADCAVYGRGVPQHMIDIVPLGVDTARFRPDRTDYAYRTLMIPRDRKIVIYAGHMERRKGVHSLIEAAIELLVKRKRADISFLICGNKGDESKEFEQMYAGLGIEDSIRFGGYRDDLAQLYTSCFCGVIPSIGWDSFTYASVEMAAAGLPVVASRLQGLPEAVLDGQTGLLFEPGNAKALANCLEVLLDRPEIAAEFGRRGRQRCERELNIDVQRQRLLKVVRKHLGRASGRVQLFVGRRGGGVYRETRRRRGTERVTQSIVRKLRKED